MQKFLLLSLFFFACQTDSPQSGKASPEPVFDKKKTEADVRQMLNEYHAAIQKDGLTAEFDYLDVSADFYWVPPGFTSAINYDSVKTILEQNADMFQSVNFQWKTLEVFPLSDEIASFTGTVSGEMVDTAGMASSVSLIESGTAIRRKDGWKLLCGQSRNL